VPQASKQRQRDREGDEEEKVKVDFSHSRRIGRGNKDITQDKTNASVAGITRKYRIFYPSNEQPFRVEPVLFCFGTVIFTVKTALKMDSAVTSKVVLGRVQYTEGG
jgi:hypothetical protein